MTINLSPPHHLMRIRRFHDDAERERGQKQLETQWQHVRPASVLIAAIGNHWAMGSWQRVVDMMMHCWTNNVYAGLSEVQDRCFDPYDALGTMRNEALLMAQNEGFEWLCYVDADVQPEPDCLMRLLSWDLPIVAPYVVEPGSGVKLHGPHREPNSGLQPIKWTVLSMLLFRTSVFNCVGPRFWSDAIGADEGFHFATLWHYGHRPYLDTTTQLVTAGKPHYPLSTNRWAVEDRQKHWADILHDLARPPDRRPVKEGTPGCIKGQYMPFLPKEQWDKAGGDGQGPKLVPVTAEGEKA